MAENKTMMVEVEISEEKLAALKEFAAEYKVTPAQILGNYVSDLIDMGSNGSDERSMARDYFDRTWLSWMMLEDV